MANLHPVPKVPVPCRSVISIGGKWEPPWKLDAAALGSQVRYARVADDDGIWWHGTRGGWVDAAVPAAERTKVNKAVGDAAIQGRIAADGKLAHKALTALEKAIDYAAVVRPGDEYKLEEMVVEVADVLSSASKTGGGKEERRLPDAMLDCASRLRATGLEGEVTYNDLARVLNECYSCLHAEFSSEWRASRRKFAIRGTAKKTGAAAAAAAAAAARRRRWRRR